MKDLREAAKKAISSLPESATIEDMMYRLYVIDKVHKGQKAVREGKTISTEDLKKEVSQW